VVEPEGAGQQMPGRPFLCPLRPLLSFRERFF